MTKQNFSSVLEEIKDVDKLNLRFGLKPIWPLPPHPLTPLVVWRLAVA